MKLTKQGNSAIERAILNNEGKDESYEHSPYKKALALEKVNGEIADLQRNYRLHGGKGKYTPRRLAQERNTLIKYFNARGAEYTMLTK